MLKKTLKNDSSAVQYTDPKAFQNWYIPFTKKEIRGEDIISNFEKFNNNLTIYSNNLKLKSCYQNFLEKGSNDDYSALKNQVITRLNEYQNLSGKFSISKSFSYLYMQEILDQEQIRTKMVEKLNKDQSFYSITNQTSYDRINSTFIIGLDHECHICYQKTNINTTLSSAQKNNKVSLSIQIQN